MSVGNRIAIVKVLENQPPLLQSWLLTEKGSLIFHCFLLWCLSSPGINERVNITLLLRNINTLPLINPITQLALPADLTFKMTHCVASHMVDGAQVLLSDLWSNYNVFAGESAAAEVTLLHQFQICLFLCLWSYPLSQRVWQCYDPFLKSVKILLCYSKVHYMPYANFANVDTSVWDTQAICFHRKHLYIMSRAKSMSCWVKC